MEWKTLLTERRDSSSKRRGGRDLRTEFQRDYHRIIISASFRRLQDKTQVFPLNRGDFVRTRLTHSLEVSSIAKSMAISAFSKIAEDGIDPSVDASVIRDTADILECAGLLHDIGNPPFGHFGEEVIRSWFWENLDKLKFCSRPASELLDEQMKGDLLNFEGNAQALRLLTRLHYLLDTNGMHLTYALLATIIKYPVSSLDIDSTGESVRAKKMGYYKAEQDIYEKISAETGTHGMRYPLTFLLEAADDIAYKTADIEDAVKRGMISIYDLKADLQNYCCTGEYQDIGEALDLLDRCLSDAQSRTGVNNKGLNAIQNWLIRIQAALIDSTVDCFVENYHKIMHGKLDTELLKLSRSKSIVDALGKIARRRVFMSDFIISQEIAAGNILNTLLDRLVPACLEYSFEDPGKGLKCMLMQLVSENYKNTYITLADGKSLGEQLYLRLLLVTDFICGMTDTYAQNMFNNIIGYI